MITPDWVVKNHHVGYWEGHEMTAFDKAWDIAKEDKYCEFCGKPGDFPKYEDMGGLRTCDSCYDSEQQGFLDFLDAEELREMLR